MALAQKNRIIQDKNYAGAVIKANPLRDILFVDSTNGVNGNDGESRLHPVLTLTRALAIASAGDTIVLEPGGSETVTAAIAANLANVRIVCPVDNPANGFTISGAGTLDLISVTAAGVHIEGLKFAHTGATANASGILASAAANGITVKNCLFDDTAISSTKTGLGVEITAGCDDPTVDDCKFLDVKRGVEIVAASTAVTDRPTIKNSKFFIGGSAFFGIYMAAGTGAVQGVTIENCIFHEADGDGSAATTAWDGTDGTNATQGPISLGAAVDQYIVKYCQAQTSLTTTFDNINAINSGANGEIVDCGTETSGDVTNVYSDTTAIHSDTTAIHSQTTTVESDTTAIHSQTTAIESDCVKIESDAAAIESELIVVHSETTVIASDTVVIESDIADIASDTTVIESDCAGIQSDTTAIHSDTTAIHSQTTTVESDTTAIHSQTTAIESDCVKIESDAAAIESELIVVHSETTVIASDCVVIESDTAKINSDTTAIHSQTTAIESDAAAIESELIVVHSETTVIASDTVVIESDTTAIHSQTTTIESDTTAIHSQTTVIESDTTIIASDIVIIDAWQPRTAKKASLALDGDDVDDILTISNGPILCLGLFMHITEAVSANACTVYFSLDPTTGASNTNLCADGTDIASAAIGDVFYIQGASADALVKGAIGTAVALGIQDGHGIFLPPGGIDYEAQNSDPSSGIADVYLVYIPLTSTSSVA